MKITLNILILPLLGGYLFIRRYLKTKYKARRYRGYHIFFNSAIAGCVLLGLSYLSVVWIESAYPFVANGWDRIVPYPHTGKAVGAFLLGYTGGYFVNLLIYLRRQISWRLSRYIPECAHKVKHKLERAVHDFKNPYPHERDGLTRDITRVINERGDSFEMFLAEAMIEWKQVMVTLSSGKVYIGYVVANFDPSSDREYVKILKSASGYRDDKTQSFNLTTAYGDYVEKSINKFESVTIDDFTVVIPVSSIVGISYFDKKVFRVFDTKESSEEEEDVDKSIIGYLSDWVGLSNTGKDES